MLEDIEAPVSENASPRKIYYGWYILAGCFIMMFLGMATRNSFGLFLKPMIEDFGLSRAALSLPFSLCLILYGASQPLGGLMMRRWDPKTVIIWGSVLTTIAMLGISQADSLWGVYLFFGVLLGVGGIGNSLTAFTPLVSSWFPDRRGLGMSLVSAGASMGQLALLPLFAYLMGFLDWRTTSLVIGILFIFTMMPISIFVVRNAPKADEATRSPAASGGGVRMVVPYDLPWVECLHKAPFVLLLTSFFTCGFTVTVVSVHWVPFATDVGFPATVAATAFALGGGLNTVGVLAVGPLSDKIGRKVPLSMVYAFRGLGFILFIFFKNDFTVWAAPMMIGLSWIATVPLTSALTGDFFGPRNVAILFGLITFSHQLGSGLSAWLSGYIYDVTGSYNLAFALAAYLCFQAAVIVTFINEKEVRIAHTATA